MAESDRSTMPTWHGPFGDAPISVFNSMTLNKVPFVTMEQNKSAESARTITLSHVVFFSQVVHLWSNCV